MEDHTRVHAIIHGRVQGVFYRMETKRAAERIGVTGWVRNKMDGTVEAVFEGSQEKVLAIIEWCRQGPPHASVTKIDTQTLDYTGEFAGFNVAY